VSPEAWDVLDLVLALLFAVGFFYYYVAGVADRNRALSRSAALAFFVCGVLAVVFLVRILT
jgi:cytochrome c biogenesis factor